MPPEKITKHFYPANTEVKKTPNHNPESIESTMGKFYQAVQDSCVSPDDKGIKESCLNSIREFAENNKPGEVCSPNLISEILEVINKTTNHLEAVNRERKNLDPLNNL